MKEMPIPTLRQACSTLIAQTASDIHSGKKDWDGGNEISPNFLYPWILRESLGYGRTTEKLEALESLEQKGEREIQELYAEINYQAYKLYGVSDETRAIIEETLGERPPEVLWPQMEGKTKDQKRMEHVWRLLSYAVKRVVEADADGIVPLIAISGETALVDRVRDELAALFPDQDAYQLEVDIGNELRRKVKGYRSVDGLDEWLRDCYFEYHVSLYKKRPIYWHIASRTGRGDCAFGALVHYHRFDQNRLAKLRGSYLRDAIALFRREAGLADKDGRIEDRLEWQARLEEAEALNERLRWVQEGINGQPAPGDCRIRTPWKSDDALPDGWQPDLDDGVAVNIRPLQTAGVLRVESVL